MTIDRKRWGKLYDRYEDPTRAHRMLALDGGGILGLITLEVLVELEGQLRDQYNDDDLRLCEVFDYVAGTSTGAIIAAGIARGMSAKDLLSFYKAFGEGVFQKRSWYQRWKSLYDNGELQKKLIEVIGEETRLFPDDLETLLLVVTRNQSTDSAWPISSNPDAKYNHPDRADCNLKIPLWQLVRASTAAPVFFPPEVLHWDPKDRSKSFVFVDGGTTPYNNPAFVQYRMATEPVYRLNWGRGETQLAIVSIGTGRAPVLGDSSDDVDASLLDAPVVQAATNTLRGLMSQAAYDQDMNCRLVGRCVEGLEMDREVWDLIPYEGDPHDNAEDRKVRIPLERDQGREFLYARYDADVTQYGLEQMGLGHYQSKDVTALDSIEHMEALSEIGQKVAKKVTLDHLGALKALPLYKRSHGR